jgi:hypothetical protein
MLRIFIQNKVLNSNSIERFINTTRSKAAAQFNNILSIIPPFLQSIEAELGSGIAAMIEVLARRDK